MTQKTIYDIIEETGSIFKEREVFRTDYIPETYKYRDTQLDIMALYSKGLMENQEPTHLLLKGGSATGKTSAVKYFFQILEERYPNVITVHVNCETHRTEYKVYSKIYQRLFNKNTSMGGLSVFNIYNRILDEIVKQEKILIVALDDFGSIKATTDLNRTLYSLSRASEIKEGAKVSVFTITDKETMLFLDPHVVTTYHPIEVSFLNYRYDEIHSILKDRCRIGYFKSVISDEIIEDVARYTYDYGDLREGIRLLSYAGKKAENEGCHKILKRHFN